MKSILSDVKRCYVCHSTFQLEDHHIYFGKNRKLSEKYGCKCWLCYSHHRGIPGVHFNHDLDHFLKEECQKKFEEKYPELDFRKIFGKNYKEE